MKKLIAFTILCAGLFAASALADTGSANEQSPSDASIPGVPMEKPHRKRVRGAHASNDESVRGHCTVVQSAQNPIASDCASLVLILVDAKGSELARTRTTPKGEFEFNLPEGKPAEYNITLSSPSYKVVSWERPVGHNKVDLKLQQQ